MSTQAKPRPSQKVARAKERLVDLRGVGLDLDCQLVMCPALGRMEGGGGDREGILEARKESDKAKSTQRTAYGFQVLAKHVPMICCEL